MTTVAAYPYQRWPKVARAQLHRLRRCVRRLPLSAPDRARRVLEQLLGADVSIRAGAPGVWRADHVRAGLHEPLVAAILAAPEVPARVALELEPRLAAGMVERTLGGTGSDAAAAMTGPLEEAERGVLAYVLARGLSAASDRPWRVVTVATRTPVLAEALGDGCVVVWPAEVAIGTDPGTARLWVAETTIDALPDEPPPQRTWMLESLPLELAADGGRASLLPDDARSLRAGDIVVLDDAWIHPQPRGWAGCVRVRVANAGRTAWWCDVDPRGLRLRAIDETKQPPNTEGRRMQGDDKTDGIMSQVGDAPIEIAVELARFTMPLQDLGSLRAGEIVATGRAVGERVTLRTGDRAIATGELVDVDGEVGVRVVDLGDTVG